ncbi:MAG: hypothetical protein KC464_27285, partial [Myxococcales bacterium]|nr:hypothetical protein [Myxococcales bacterium]
FTIGAIASVTSCGGSAPDGATTAARPATASAATLIDALEATAVRACACETLRCAVALQDQVDVLLEDPPAELTLDDAAAARYGRAALGALRCTYGAVDDDAQRHLDRVAGLRDRACACTDATCGEAALADLDALRHEDDMAVHVTDRHDELEHAGVAAYACLDALRVGPLYGPFPVADTRGVLPACEERNQVLAQLVRCERAPRPVRTESLRLAVETFVDWTKPPTDGALAFANEMCDMFADMARSHLRRFGCAGDER